MDFCHTKHIKHSLRSASLRFVSLRSAFVFILFIFRSGHVLYTIVPTPFSESLSGFLQLSVVLETFNITDVTPYSLGLYLPKKKILFHIG